MLVVKGVSESWYDSRPTSKPCFSSLLSFPSQLLLEKLKSTVIPLQKLNINGVLHDQIIYLATFPLPTPGDLPSYVMSEDTAPMTRASLLWNLDITSDLSKFVVIVRRGTCTS